MRSRTLQILHQPERVLMACFMVLGVVLFIIFGSFAVASVESRAQVVGVDPRQLPATVSAVNGMPTVAYDNSYIAAQTAIAMARVSSGGQQNVPIDQAMTDVDVPHATAGSGAAHIKQTKTEKVSPKKQPTAAVGSAGRARSAQRGL